MGQEIDSHAIYSDVMTSLEQLSVNLTDMYGLHQDHSNVPVGKTLEILNEHIEAGRISSIGGSTCSHQRLAEANEYAYRHGTLNHNCPYFLGLHKHNEIMSNRCSHKIDRRRNRLVKELENACII
jgi:aryl-alcohol dehydrogenase-like predicted oxidoreductase